MGIRESRYVEIEADAVNQLISPCIDVVFKAIMGTEKNKRLLESLVSSILNVPMDELEVKQIKNTELSVRAHDDKAGRLDIRAVLKDGTDLDIEIQVNPMDSFNERSLYYWSKIYSDNLRRGDGYYSLKKCIVINILDFKHFKHDQMHTCYHIFEDELQTKLTDHLEMHYIELPKINSYNRSKENPRMIEWMEFLRIKDGDTVSDMKKYEWSEEILEALEELKELSQDPEMREVALSREIALRDQYQRLYEATEKGIEIGMEKGAELKNREVAINFKRQGVDVTIISTCTGFTVEEIEKM